MKILYISDHSILEYDELQLFTDLGHDCFSLGAYHNLGHDDLPRPRVKNLVFHEDLNDIYVQNPNRTDLHHDLIDWPDIIIVMHSPQVIIQNWDKLRTKTVVWRSIGQSTPHIEERLAPMRKEGLKIVRYSPKEENIQGFIGSDAMIRFYKDENEFKDWTGNIEKPVSFAQSLKGRRDFCHYDEVFNIIEKYNGKVFGPGNEDLGMFNGGQLPFKQQLQAMKDYRLLPYGGTWPAPYTLSFIEALMTGLPIVAISKSMAHLKQYEPINFYEVDEMLADISGIVCDSVQQMEKQTEKLLKDYEHAQNIAKRQRELAVRLFGKRNISHQWEDFLNAIA